DDAVCDRELSHIQGLLAGVRGVPDRCHSGGRQAAREPVQEQPEVAFLLRESVERLEAVDDDDSRVQLFEEAVDHSENLRQPIFAQDIAKVLVYDTAVTNGAGIKEVEGLAVAKDLVKGFG